MRWIAILGLLTLLTVAFTFPMVLHLGDSVVAQAYNDTYYSIWIFRWEAHQLVLDPLHLFDANIYYPLRNTLAFSEIILPEALMFLPLDAALGNPVLAYNLVLLAILPLNGLAMYLWVYHNLRKHALALFAACALSFCTYLIGELRHIQLVAILWMPLTLLYVQKFMAAPTRRNLFFAFLFFAVNTLSSLYYAVFLSIILALYGGWMLLTRAWRLERRHLVLGIFGVLGLAVVLAPFLIPFIQAERTWQFSAQRNPLTFSARPASFLATVPGNWVYGPLLAQFPFFWASRGQPLFVGWVTLALAIVGLFASPRAGWKRERGFFVLLIVVGFALSFGPGLILSRDNNPVPLPFSLPYAWIARLPILSGLGAPARLALLMSIALTALAAIGAQQLIARLPQRRLGPVSLASVAWIALAALVLVEHMSAPLKLREVPVGDTVPGVYRFLARQPVNEPVVELPMGLPTFVDADNYGHYVYFSTYNWHPLVNGYSSFLPPTYAGLVERELRFPYPDAVNALRDLGVVWLIVRPLDAPNLWTVPEAVPAILATQEDITFVARYGDILLYRLEY